MEIIVMVATDSPATRRVQYQLAAAPYVRGFGPGLNDPFITSDCGCSIDSMQRAAQIPNT